MHSVLANREKITGLLLFEKIKDCKAPTIEYLIRSR